MSPEQVWPQTAANVPAIMPDKPLAPLLRVAFFRASNNEFRMGKLAQGFSKLMASEIVAMTQSESDGFVSLSIVYR